MRPRGAASALTFRIRHAAIGGKARYGAGGLEQEFHVDLDELRRNVDRAEVISLFFPYLRRTLLLDMRCTSVDPPLAQVVPMVASSEERVESLRRLRPRFDRPERMILIPWPRYVASVKALGVWQVMTERLTGAGGSACEVSMERCYRELLREERAEFRRAITGEGYRTLWPVR